MTALGDLPHAADVRAFDPGSAGAGFLLPGLVEHQHRISAAEVVGDEPAYHRLGLPMVPDRMVEQPLHPVRAVITGVLGQRPPVLTRQVSDQPVDVLTGLRGWFSAGEAPPQPLQQLRPPLAGHLGSLYHVHHGRLVFVLIHNQAGCADGRPHATPGPARPPATAMIN